MENYTLLLVDDEEDVVQAIIRKIDWNSIGFKVIGYASNGVKALEMMEEYQPDVVMSDVRMPYMDGIELAKHIRTEYPETKIIFFTGFDEFEYAKEAVHLEVEEYILKPASAIELTEVFTRMWNKITQEVSEKRNIKTLEEYYVESLPLLQNNFYSMLIEGRVRDDEVDKYLKDYRIELSGPYYGCVIIHTSSTQLPDGMNYVLLMASVGQLAKERLGDKWGSRFFSYQGNTVLIIQMENESDITEVTDEWNRFCRYAKRMTGAVVTVGIGHVTEHMTELTNSYTEAKEAVSYRAIFGVNRAINIKEILPCRTDNTDTSNDEELAYLFKMIRLSSTDHIEEAVSNYLARAAFVGRSLQQHQLTVMELVSSLFRFMANNNIESEPVLEDTEKLYTKILGMEPEQMKRWLIDISMKLCEQMTNSRKTVTKSYVTKAREYVETHYADEDLSLDTVCEYLGVSNAYFSTVFKKETGKTFVAYLTSYRMEEAAKMILQSGEKNYVIARKVGYSDPNYFSYVFKRQFGVSPSKYGVNNENK